MKETNKLVAAFRLIGITTEEFATFRENYDADNPKLEIGLNVQIKANQQNHLVGMFTRFTFNQKDSTVLILESACHFKIEEDFWKSIHEEQEIILPPDFATHLLVLSVGTARGIIHAKKPGWLENLVLTTLDVSTIFANEEIKVALSEEELDS